MVRRGPHNNAITWPEHCQISWGGTLGTGTKEIWTCGVRMVHGTGSPTGPTVAQLNTFMTGMNTVVAGWVTDPAARLGQAVHWGWIKANWILTTGLQRDSLTNRFDSSTATRGVGSAIQPSWAQTYCLTFGTGFKRGRAHSGRVFPPVVAVPSDPDSGLCDQTPADDMAASMAGLLIEFQRHYRTDIGIPEAHLAVISPANSLKGQGSVQAQIMSVVCDRVADVQHRRTNRLPRTLGAVAPVIA